MYAEYLHEYTDDLERVLSLGYHCGYSTSALEREIAYSSFFLKLEDDGLGLPPIVHDEDLVNEVLSEIKTPLKDVPVYNPCLWAAEAFLRILLETRLTFECIFLYLPIAKMYELFPLFHEMDFSQIIQEFKRRYHEKSAFAILLENYGYSLKYVSEQTGLSYDSLQSWKQRRRNIQNGNVKDVFKLARVFHVRMETIAELPQ